MFKAVSSWPKAVLTRGNTNTSRPVLSLSTRSQCRVCFGTCEKPSQHRSIKLTNQTIQRREMYFFEHLIK